MNIIRAVENYDYWSSFNGGNRETWEEWRRKEVEEWHLDPEILKTEQQQESSGYITKIQLIYSEVFGKTKEAAAADQELTDRVKTEILDKVGDFQSLPRRNAPTGCFLVAATVRNMVL